MIFPIDKYLAQDYRNVLRTQGAPQMIEDSNPIIPVVDIQKGLPRPNSKQKLRWTTVYVSNASTYYQIATNSSTKKHYFLGVYGTNSAAVDPTIIIFDASSGNYPALSANTAYQDQLGWLYTYGSVAITTYNHFFPLPIEVTNGIRMHGGGAGIASSIIVFYIEETI